MPIVGETKERFGRSYIYLNPESSIGDSAGTAGTWRLRVDDTGTPIDDGGGGGGGGDVDLSVTGTAGESIIANELVRLDENGFVTLASAASIELSNVVGVATATANAGETITYTRNVVETFYNTGTVIEGAPANLVPGQVYFLSTTPGNWTTTPDTATPGAVVRSCGIAVDISKMSIEIQIATVI